MNIFHAPVVKLIVTKGYVALWLFGWCLSFDQQRKLYDNHIPAFRIYRLGNSKRLMRVVYMHAYKNLRK